MDTKVIASIAKNHAHLTGATWTDHGTSDGEARVIADSCLKAVEVHRDVLVAEEYVQVAERRLESCNGSFAPHVRQWAEEIISDTRAFLFAAETERRS